LQSFPIIFPFLYFVLPWIHFYDSSLTTSPTSDNSTVTTVLGNGYRNSQVPVEARNPRKDKMKPKVKFKALDRICFYFRAPVTKFHYSMVGTQYSNKSVSICKAPIIKNLNLIHESGTTFLSVCQAFLHKFVFWYQKLIPCKTVQASVTSFCYMNLISVTFLFCMNLRQLS